MLMMKFALSLVVVVVMTGTVAGLSREVIDALYKLLKREVGYVLLSSYKSSFTTEPEFYVEEVGPWGASVEDVKKKLTNDVSRFVLFIDELCADKGRFIFAWVGGNAPSREKYTFRSSYDYLKLQPWVPTIDAGYYSDDAYINSYRFCAWT